MWKAIAFTAALLAAILLLTRLQSGHPGLPPTDQLAFERARAERLRLMLETHEAVPADLACPAARAGDATVQTLYIVWINHRADLVTTADRDLAADDLSHAIAVCGQEADRLEQAAHQRGMELQAAVALVMLKVGR